MSHRVQSTAAQKRSDGELKNELASEWGSGGAAGWSCAVLLADNVTLAKVTEQ